MNNIENITAKEAFYSTPGYTPEELSEAKWSPRTAMSFQRNEKQVTT